MVVVYHRGKEGEGMSRTERRDGRGRSREGTHLRVRFLINASPTKLPGGRRLPQHAGKGRNALTSQIPTLPEALWQSQTRISAGDLSLLHGETRRNGYHSPQTGHGLVIPKGGRVTTGSNNPVRQLPMKIIHKWGG